MKIKTSELTGLALTWLVLQLENPEDYFSVILNEGRPEIWHDSAIGTRNPTFDRAGKPRFIRASDGALVSLFGSPIEGLDWEHCGPIIERERLSPQWNELWKQWTIPDRRNAAFSFMGPTFLIAAMRCFVASKLGDEVDVPEGLE